jgi:hypothetical protein
MQYNLPRAWILIDANLDLESGKHRFKLYPVLRIRDVDPGFGILIFFHPRPWIQQEQKKGEGELFLPFCSYKFDQINNHFSFEKVSKKLIDKELFVFL